jgi:hypothetical protein
LSKVISCDLCSNDEELEKMRLIIEFIPLESFTARITSDIPSWFRSATQKSIRVEDLDEYRSYLGQSSSFDAISARSGLNCSRFRISWFSLTLFFRNFRDFLS